MVESERLLRPSRTLSAWSS